jgi:hypothetical protein
VAEHDSDRQPFWLFSAFPFRNLHFSRLVLAGFFLAIPSG